MKKLSEDVVIYIFLSLRVKSLMRFKCISRTWYSLIQSSTFINLHLNRSSMVTDEFLFIKRSIKEETNQYRTILSFHSGTTDGYFNTVSPDLHVPCLTSSYSSNNNHLIGPCHGLIALMGSPKTIIFNPSIRNYRLLPPSPSDCVKGICRCIKSFGFGFDSVANDYKIIRLSEVYKEDRYGYLDSTEKTVEIYYWGTDSWKESDQVDQEFPRLYWLPCSQMFYNGACHGIAIVDVDTLVILCFEVSTEIFRSMKIPETCQYLDGPHYSLVILNDSLSLICYPYKEPVIDPKKDLIDIWIMKDYSVYESWIKIYTIRGLSIEIPLVVWRDYMLLLQSKHGQLMSYDLNSNEVKEFNFHGWAKSLRAVVYKESLMLIPRGINDITQVQKF